MYAKMKESFTLYTSYSEQLELLTMEQRGILFTAILAFERNEELPDMDELIYMAFSFITSRIREDEKKNEEIAQKRREGGKRGGRPKNLMVSNDTQNNLKVFQEDREERTKEETEENIKEKPPKGGKEKRRFSPPSLQDVQDYKTSRGDKGENVDPETFIDFYESKGWKVGNQPMKDWKAAFRTWEKREKPVSRSGTSKITPWNQFPQREYDDDALEKLLIESM
ncbi:MAG: hypothetical protein IKF90_10135 [Parasporobacterium sp.]|nr:hypothetical protein [Parasporobacterium sp.]